LSRESIISLPQQPADPDKFPSRPLLFLIGGDAFLLFGPLKEFTPIQQTFAFARKWGFVLRRAGWHASHSGKETRASASDEREV
jgi:hypothetical protein